MTALNVDEAIECYLNERKKNRREAAETRFLGYAYLVCGERDTAAFMKKTRRLVMYYIDYLTVLENPLRGPQAAWLGLMILVGILGCYLVIGGGMPNSGLVIIAGTLVNGISLARAVSTKWTETAITIALYREIIELIDQTVMVEG